MRLLPALLPFAVALTGQTVSEEDRAYLVSHLDMTREFLTDTTQGLSTKQWLYSPGPKRWSIAQCVDHLARTEEYVLKLLVERMLTSDEPLIGAFPSTTKNRKQVKDRPRRMSRAEDALVIRWMTDRTAAGTAPVEARPPIEELAPRASFDDPRSVLEDFLKIRAETIAWLKATDDDLRGHFAQSPMPLFPEMQFSDAYQWLLRMSAHTERHLMQIHEVRRSKGYPQRPD